jgi:cell wall-associated NlpC family hydrolase
MDRRLTPFNGTVAALSLAGQVDAPRFTAGEPRSVTTPLTDLLATPTGPRDRQLLKGTQVTVFEDRDGLSFLQSARDGYCGWAATAALGPLQTPTHLVATRATHIYRDEDIKSPDLAHLSFGAQVTVTNERRKFWETPNGFIPKPALRPLDKPFRDPVTVAQLHFGTPYLWGGNSVLGIDCSGLVQAALLACAVPCPGDSDLQRSIGTEATGDPRRGDLWFWKGHVAMVVDADTLIHANAHHMATAYEPLRNAPLRIEAQGDGPVIARRRVSDHVPEELESQRG